MQIMQKTLLIMHCVANRMLMSGILNFNSVCYDADDSIDVWIEKFVSKDKYS